MMGSEFGSEQGELIVGGRRAFGAMRFEETVSGDEQVKLAGVALHAPGEAGGGEELVEGVSDVFEFVIELVAVAVEPILEAFEEIGG